MFDRSRKTVIATILSFLETHKAARLFVVVTVPATLVAIAGIVWFVRNHERQLAYRFGENHISDCYINRLQGGDISLLTEMRANRLLKKSAKV